MRWRAVLVVAGIVATLGATTSARADTFNVNTNADGSSTTCDVRVCTIRGALAQAAANGTTTLDTINVPADTYVITVGELQITSNVAIVGASAATTTIQADVKGFRVFNLLAEHIAGISHVTLTNGVASGGIGGDLLVGGGATAVLDHVRITNGKAVRGAGIGINGGSVLMSKSLVDTNQATSATGGQTDGGGITALAMGSNGLQIVDSTITNNTASIAAGMALRTSATNKVTLTRTTIAFNRASMQPGAGLYLDTGASATAVGTIIAGNTGDGGASNCNVAVTTSNGGNIDTGSTCGLDKPNTDPKLSSLTMAGGETPVLPITATSAAVDIVPAAGCTSTAAIADQRDLPRPQGAACDAGAYEVDLPPNTSIDSGPNGPVNTTSVSFTFSSDDPGATFQCSLDGGAFIKCSSPQTYSNLSEASHTFSVRALDQAGQPDPSPPSRPFSVDLTAPAAPVIGGANGAQNTTTVTLTGTAEAGATVTVLEGAAARGTTTAPNGAWTVTINNVIEGGHNYVATAKDAAGNTSGNSNTRTITVDLTAPNPPVISGANGSQNTRTVTLSGTAEANATVEVFDGAASKGTTTATGGNWTFTINNVPDGAHPYVATAKDAAGNTSGNSNTRTITVDLTAPPAPVIGGSNALQKTSTVTLTGTAEAGATVEVFDGAASKGTTTATGGTWTLTINNVGDGTHNYVATARDAAGNTSGSSNTRTINIDTTAPNPPVIGGSNATQGSPTLNLAGTAEANATVEVFEGAASKGTTTATGGNWTLTISNVNDGAHAYTAKATDAAGNTSGNSNTRTITVDSSIPDTEITDGPGDLTKSNSPAFSFTSTKANSTFRCKLDGTPYAACASPKTYTTVADGEHTFSVVATDPLNHEDPTPATVTFTVDTAAPTATIDSGPAGPINHDPTFTFHSSEDGTLDCALDDGNFAPCASPKTYGDLDEHEGDHEFRVRARDAAGNVGDSVARGFSIDKTPPPADVVSGPSGTTTDSSPSFGFASDTGSTFACRLDGPGAAQGTYGPCTSPRGFTALQPGDYVFLVRATDPAGNATTTSRAFTVTVVQQATPTPTPTVTPAQEPTPVPNKTVVIQPVSGKTLVKLPGSSKFEPVDVTRGIPNGSTVDTRTSKIRLFAIPKAGKPAESALFYQGIFKVKLAGGVTELQLVEELAKCPSGKASAAAKKKPKTRKLWGDGTGSFRTRGQYSAATVRGTRWLVQDSCGKTLTKVAKGVVEVQDFVKRKKILVRAPKSYTAKQKKR
jgi:hypothetical protein